MKILVATEKPFAKIAIDGIRQIVEEAHGELALLEAYTDVSQLYEAVADADGLIVRSDKVTAEVIDHASHLKVVVRAGAGYDNLDLAACSAKGIVAMNTPGQNSNAVAELALGMMLFMVRNNFQQGTGTELKGKTLGIQAYGHVGCVVAHLAKGFGMEVLAFDPFVPADKMISEGITPITDLKELYRRSNYLSLHIPANEKTKKSVNYDLLSLMPEGACLVNTARKEIIDEDDLMRVMEERPDFKYVSDIAPDSLDVLKEKFGERVFATAKKMGAETAEANVNAGLAAAHQVVDFLNDGVDRFRVN
ncbi:MAG TPA: NAD(P)-dependent oxidoreductase [Paludibacteraceae bacterium]|jgi:D-3-phosphoglycerate dehydrogenase|nr:NAD(P)-dependent oxidoreductase [Paludibacteraceae bacterium]HQB69485.1 NAD(P)-dependent oxidoreductase [Paludibacteraceae bacterium]HRS67944.1 NAD(P)-dependent oxidoreductase [Paludibacteraceae bacterium]